ncbi:hypothetical protein MBLNU457_2240t1 [Dothideomycetes sp. NU457]
MALINPILGQVLVAIFILLTTIAFLLRMYVRVCINRTFRWEDAWLSASQIFLLVILGLYFAIQITYQKALETKVQPPNDLLNTLTFFGLASYSVGGVCLKLSLALFFQHIAQKKWQRRLIWGSTMFYLITMNLFLFIILFRCGAPALPKIVSQSHCHVDWPVIYPIGVLMGVAHAVNYSVMVGVTVMIFLQKSSLSAGAKASVAALVGLAVLGWLAVVTRLYFMQFLAFGPTFWMRIGGWMYVLSAAEMAIGTTIISLATLKSLGREWKHRAGRAVAHMKGREYTRDSASARMVPRHHTTMMPTVTYHNMTVDFDTLKTIGVLPDIEEDLDSWKPQRPEKAYHFAQPTYLPSIGEVIFDDQSPTRTNVSAV